MWISEKNLSLRKGLGMYIVEMYVSEDRTVHFLWVHLCLLFPADPDVFRNILEFLFHFQVRSQKSQKSVVGPCSSSWGSHGPCHLFVVPHSDCFLLGFGYDGSCLMLGALFGFMGSCSSAFPPLRTPGRAGFSLSK